MDDEKAALLLEEIFNLWTDIFEGEDGNERRLPASSEEAAKSRELLSKISTSEMSDENLVQRYKQIESIISDYEKKLIFQKTPNGQADKLLDDIFDIWSEKWYEDGAQYGNPANEDEVNQSWDIINQIEKIDFDDEAVKERLQSYQSVLDDFQESKITEQENDYSDNKDNQQAFEILDKVYNSWSTVSYEGDEKYRNPKNKREIRKSKADLKKISSLKITDPEITNRVIELENVLKSYEDAIPGYSLRIIFSLLLSFGILAAFYFLYTANGVHPDFKYDADKFIIDKEGGELKWASFSNSDKSGKIDQKITLSPGTKVKPIARYGKFFFQIETEGGQRGLIRDISIKMTRYVEAGKKAKIFDQIGAKEKEIIPPGTKGTVIDRVTKGKGIMADRYIKVRLEDGRIKWASDFSFNIIGLKEIPKLNDKYKYSTTRAAAESNIIGKPLSEIENRYGLALSIDKIRGQHQAFFKQLVIVDKEKHFDGILVKFDKNDIAKEIAYTSDGETRWLDSFPYVDKIREYEPGRIQNFLQYDRNRFQPQWWNNLRKYNLFTGILCFGVDILVWILGIILFIILTRIIVNPILQLFAFPRILGNGLVSILDTIVIFVAAYLAFILLIFIEDGFFFIGVIFFFTTIGMILRNISNINYNRCPSCHTMYSALGEGSTYTGRTTSVTWGTYDVYKGTSETDTTITTHYEKRSTKTTEDVDHYLDHQMCARCGYNWDVDREESESRTAHL